MKKISLLFLLSWFLHINTTIAQSVIGLPAIRNFNSADYNAATNIFDIKQDKSGILYLANNDGLLTFDGNYWKLYPLPNKGTIKSLAIDSSGKIYVGGQDEVGYFYPDQRGVLKYHSLKQLLPQKARQFADIWDIVIFNHEVFFRTIEALFELKNNNTAIKVFDASGGWRIIAKTGTQLYADDRDDGLFIFKNSRWQPLSGKIHTAGLQITGIVDYGQDTVLVSTLKQGLYLLNGGTINKKNTGADPIFSNDLVNCIKKIDTDRIAIGTSANGIIIIDKNGRLIQKFSNQEGLQNSNVINVFSDHDKNLWLSLENGAAFINYQSAIKHIYPVKNNQTVSSAIRIFNQKLYIGTSDGLFSSPLDLVKKDISFSKGDFTEVANTKGQVWSLAEINKQLLLAHRDGAYVIKDNKAIPIMTKQGVWSFQNYPHSDNIIAGTYTGLQLIKDNGNGTFSDGGKINGVYESLNNIAIDNLNNIWASHPYRGLFKMQIVAEKDTILHYENLKKENGLPSNLNNRVYFIRNKVLIATEKGVYEYNAALNKCVISTFFKPIFNNTAIEYLTEDASGNIWFVNNQRVGVIDFSKPANQKPYTIIYFPELTSQTVKGLEFIYPYNNENIFVGSNNGIFHLNYNQYVESDAHIKVLLSTVKAIAEKDSVIFGGYFFNENNKGTDQSLKQIISLPNRYNSFHFEYSSSLYTQNCNVEFSHKLIGFDKGWSAWSAKTEKDYTNIPYGIYTFSVIARNNLGNESKPVNYTFIVTPAWYQTAWIYLIYLALILLLIQLLVVWQRKRFAIHQKKHEEEQARLSYLHSLELDRSEKEIIALQKDNLEAELQFKNKELATITMHLVERGGMLINIKQALLTLIKKTSIPDAEHQFRSVFRTLDEIEKNAGDWNHFAIYFDQVHNNFLSTLKAKFPGISSTDLKLCAYLRLNLSSKEIAQLMNISLKGVEISRYRIRKKLNLSTEINLYDFLIEVTRHPPQK